MAKALKCEYEIDIPEFSKVSAEARDLVQKLLLASPEERLTAEQVMMTITITIIITLDNNNGSASPILGSLVT